MDITPALRHPTRVKTRTKRILRNINELELELELKLGLSLQLAFFVITDPCALPLHKRQVIDGPASASDSSRLSTCYDVDTLLIENIFFSHASIFRFQTTFNELFSFRSY